MVSGSPQQPASETPLSFRAEWAIRYLWLIVRLYVALLFITKKVPFFYQGF